MNRKRRHHQGYWAVRRTDGGFTLVELLITMSIISILAGMMLVATFAAQEAAKEQKTKALIAKLDSVIRQKWEAYRTRAASAFDIGPDQFTDNNSNGTWDSGEPITFDHNGNNSWDPAMTPAEIRKARIDVMHDLMRMELPDRWTDVTDPPAAPLSFPATQVIPRPSVSQAYLRKMPVGATPEHQQAECLYLIITAAAAEEGDSRDVFKAGDVGDTDNDGAPEFLDGWKQPIRFLRWAPGFDSELQVITRGEVQSFNGMSQQATLTAVGQQYSQTPGAYAGGTVAILDSTTNTIRGDKMARITEYTVAGTTVTFGFNTLIPARTPATMQQPFSGNSPNAGDLFVVLAPDPFDSAQVYPRYNPNMASPPAPVDTSLSIFATYPLIFSAGPDKAYGILGDTASMPFSYANHGLYPIVIVNTKNQLFGAQTQVGTEPDGAWRDNIHNHLIGLR